MEKILENLKTLSKDEKRAVVAMLILLQQENAKPENKMTVVGDSPEKLEIWHCSDSYKKELCERLVEKEIFIRQHGDDEPRERDNASISDDNWYSFNRDVAQINPEAFDLIAGFIHEIEQREAQNFRRECYAMATIEILTSTYL